MRYAIYYWPSGEVCGMTGIINEEAINDLDEPPPGALMLISDIMAMPGQHQILNGEVNEIPENTGGPNFAWNYEKQEWAVDEVRIRQEAVMLRNQLLADSDYTQLADSPMTGGERQKWAIYRKKLRDITEQPGFPADVVWPDPPEAGTDPND